MNYTELVAAVVAEASNNNDTDFIANIPVMVDNAEKRIYQAVKIPDLRKTENATFTAGSPNVALPSDYLDTFELAHVDGSGIYTYLIPKDASYIREMYPNPTTAGTPKYFAQPAPYSVVVAPTPSVSTTGLITYFYYPESIVTAENTWLGDNFAMTLFYAVMVEAAVFMKSEEDVMKQYATQFSANMKLLLDYSNGSLRSKGYR